MKAQLRIIAGSLRRRKLTCNVQPGLRPTPDKVRQALFNILEEAIKDSCFVDVFAGTGINGFEALSRGASLAVFVERHFGLAKEIQKHVAEFDLADRAQLVRANVYHWAKSWEPPKEALCLFISPPFADLSSKKEEFLELIAQFQHVVETGSILVIQDERQGIFEHLPDKDNWQERVYGRNVLLFWKREEMGSGTFNAQHASGRSG